VVVILCAFCSVIKRHELLPIAIWSNWLVFARWRHCCT